MPLLLSANFLRKFFPQNLIFQVIINKASKGENKLGEQRKKRAAKIGLPPGTLIHIGEKKVEEVKITLVEYSAEFYSEKTLSSLEECPPIKETSTIKWLNITGLHQIELLEEVGSCFDIHPLVLEDILNTTERPKLENYENYLFFILKRFTLSDDGEEIEDEQTALVLGENYLLSFEEKENHFFELIREQLKIGQNLLRKSGADYLA